MASTTGKNRSILAGLVAPVTETPTVERGAPATERLSTRLTGLVQATVQLVQKGRIHGICPAIIHRDHRHVALCHQLYGHP